MAAFELPDLHFGEFRLDPRGQQLWRGSQAVALRPRAWRLLDHLAARPGRLVSTEEIYELLWPGVAVTPKALTNLIGELRRALDDGGGPARWIETVHRRGYRFRAAPPEAGARPAAGAGAAPWRPGAPALAGRRHERARLLEHLQRAAEGQRQLVAVCGAAGIGKTALVEDLMAAVDSTVWRVARGQCIELQSEGEAFGPLLALLSDLCRGPDAAHVIEQIRRCAPCWLLQLPWLLQPGEQLRLRQALGGSGTGRMLRECLTLFELLSDRMPLLLVIEDLHWGDGATLDLLTQWAAGRRPARVMVLLSLRTPADARPQTQAEQRLQRLVGAGQVDAVDLGPLDEAAQRECLQQRYAGEPPWQAALLPHLARLSGGLPLFLVALLGHMEEQGWIDRHSGAWRHSDPPELVVERLNLPRRLAALITERTDRLDPDLRRLLETASVIGLHFAVPLLAELLGQSVDQVEHQCALLARGNAILRVATPRRWSQGREVSVYAFVHDVYRQSVLQRLPEGTRRGLHEGVARALEQAHADDPSAVAGELSAAYVAAALPADAVRVLQLAAGVARERFAYDEAAVALQTACQQLALLPDTPPRARDTVLVQLTLASVTLTSRGLRHPLVQQSYSAAAAAALRAGTPSELLRAALGQCMGQVLAGDFEGAWGQARQAIELAEVHAPPLLAMACTYAGLAAFGRADLTAARRCLERALDLVPAPGLPLFIDIHTMARFHLGRVLCMTGDLAAGVPQAMEAEQRARRKATPFDLIQTLHHVADLWRLLDRPEAAMALCCEVEQLAGRHALDLYVAYARLMRWGLAADTGSPVLPAALVRELDTVDRLADCWGAASLHLFIAQCWLRQGQPQAAAKHLDRVAQQAVPGCPLMATQWLHLQAECMTQTGAESLAVQAAWQAGWDQARRQGAGLVQGTLARRWHELAPSGASSLALAQADNG